ncbi:MAG: hypothetical protein QXJ28_02350 [Candidatus Pacearchaeota archaeon]
MSSDLMWRRLSEEEKIKIKEIAKNIIDNFSKTIENLPKSDERFIERDPFLRDEKENAFLDDLEKFREIIFSNAPLKKDNFIIAERGSWTKN